MIDKRLVGTGVALVTPFDVNLNIDFNAFKKLLQLCFAANVSYLVVNGTTGESATTSEYEKHSILSFVNENNLQKLPIVYGMGGNDTNEILRKLSNTNLQGVDVILSVCPYYNKPSQNGIYYHYMSIADASPIPILLYNVPSRTGCNITAPTVIRLSNHKNIIGIKEASGDLLQIIEIAKNKPPDFMLISGDDILTIPIISIGGVGVISTLANCFPNFVSNMVNYALNNDYINARNYMFRLVEFNNIIKNEGNPVGTKHIMHLLGICQNEVRLPLVKIPQEIATKLEQTCNFPN